MIFILLSRRACQTIYISASNGRTKASAITYQQTTLRANSFDISARQIVLGHYKLIQIHIIGQAHLAAKLSIQ